MRMTTPFGTLPTNTLIAKSPTSWGFVGRVDPRLAFTSPDGSPADPDDLRKAAQFGPGLLIRAGRIKVRTYSSEAEALAAAAELGLEVTRG